MFNQFFVVFIISIALWQEANAFIIKDQNFMIDVTDSAHVVFNNVSNTDNAMFSIVVVDNETTTVTENDEKNSYVQQESVSSIEIQAGVEIYVETNKDINDDVTSTIENEKQDDHQTLTNDSDEETNELQYSKHPQRHEENEKQEEEEDEDEEENEHDHDNDD